MHPTVEVRIKYASKDVRDGALDTGMAKGMYDGYGKLDTVLAK